MHACRKDTEYQGIDDAESRFQASLRQVPNQEINLIVGDVSQIGVQLALQIAYGSMEAERKAA